MYDRTESGPRTSYRLAIPAPLAAPTLRALQDALDQPHVGSEPPTPCRRQDGVGGVYVLESDLQPVGLADTYSARVARILAGHHINQPWSLAEEATDGRLGVLYRYTPGLGTHRAPCGAYGDPVLTAGRFNALASLTDDPATLVGLIRDHLGEQWTAAAPSAA